MRFPAWITGRRRTRRTPITLLWLIVGVLVASTVSVLAAPASPAKIWVKAGTPVSMHAQQDVSSNQFKSGASVTFVVARPVEVGGCIVIPRGTLARGSVVFAKGAGVGHGGDLIVAIDAVQTQDGNWLALRARSEASGRADSVLPESLIEYGKANFPNGRPAVLLASRVFTAYFDRTRGFRRASGRTVAARLQTLPPVPPAAKQRGTRVQVAAGLPLTVHPQEEIVSGKVRQGGSVTYLVTDPLTIQGVTVVARHAPARGTVLMATASGMAGKGGRLVLSVDAVQAVDGTWLPVRASTAQHGGGNVGIRAATNLVVPVVGLVVPGRQAVVPATMQIHVETREDRILAIAGAPAATPSPGPTSAR